MILKLKYLIIIIILNNCTSETSVEAEKTRTHHKKKTKLNWQIIPSHYTRLYPDPCSKDTFAFIPLICDSYTYERIGLFSVKLNWKDNEVDSAFTFAVRSNLLKVEVHEIDIEIGYQLNP